MFETTVVLNRLRDHTPNDCPAGLNFSSAHAIFFFGELAEDCVYGRLPVCVGGVGWYDELARRI